MYSLASFNGSKTDIPRIKRFGFGESFYRLRSVAHEILVSAARFKHSLLASALSPALCEGVPIKIILMTDRDVFSTYSELNFSTQGSCIFDEIIYFDDYPSFEAILGIKSVRSRDLFSRLAPRPNAVKLFSFLLTPFKYTLYLDGDTAPCRNFHNIFEKFFTYDVITSPNPFGYVVSLCKLLHYPSPSTFIRAVHQWGKDIQLISTSCRFCKLQGDKWWSIRIRVSPCWKRNSTICPHLLLSSQLLSRI